MKPLWTPRCRWKYLSLFCSFCGFLKSWLPFLLIAGAAIAISLSLHFTCEFCYSLATSTCKFFSLLVWIKTLCKVELPPLLGQLDWMVFRFFGPEHPAVLSTDYCSWFRNPLWVCHVFRQYNGRLFCCRMRSNVDRITLLYRCCILSYC